MIRLLLRDLICDFVFFDTGKLIICILTGQTIGIPNLGWYAFRHTYRTLLDDLGTPIGVQQKLMRHSDVRTTMNHYGSAYEKTKRRANTLVAGKLLPESMKAASRTTIH